MSTTETARTAYIFEDVGGWYICDDAAGRLDTRGGCYDSKRAAISALRQLAEAGQTTYTHYKSGGPYGRRVLLPRD